MSMPGSPPDLRFTNLIITAPSNGDVVNIPRRPSYGNTFDLTKIRIFNDSGDYIVSFRDPLWSQYDVLTFDILPITKTLADLLELFFINHVGELITIVISNVTYTGVIQDPKLELIDERSNNCNYKASFIFETEVCV